MQERTYRVAAVTLAIVGAITVYAISSSVFPYHSLNHDEGVYLQQAAMLLDGQLAMWPPVEDVLRPWFFVEDGARLYPKYAPVPSAMFALGHLLGGYRLALAGIAAANLALVVGVGREAFDRRTGLLAGGFALTSPLFLIDSSVFLPYAPTTLLNLLFAYGYFRANRTGDRRWAVVAGIAVALAFFARPFTAVLFATPFIVHAVWTLHEGLHSALERQLIVASLGASGVVLALGYNAIVTGSPLVFPYQAFAPLDGIGFGHRQILSHEIQYTPALALRANGLVVERFFTKWIAGGLLGALLAFLGLVRTAHARSSAPAAVLAGMFVSIIAGNVLFWGNYNILGDLERTGDGLISAFGPYYHFDLLVPATIFAAVGTLWAAAVVHRRLESRTNRRRARLVLVLAIAVSAAGFGSVTANDLADPLEKNLDATRTYEDAYEPFEDGPPEQSLVLLPDPYGDWLNHPFQYLRNTPDYDGRAVYALDERPFETADAFPDRRLYRYVYRGGWAPFAGSPEAARLQRVRDVSGARVDLLTTLGIPDGAIGVTARVATDEGSVHYVADDVPDSLDLALTIEDGEVRVRGAFSPVEDQTLTVDGRDDVQLTVFVDYGAGGGFAYRFDLPVVVTDGSVRALSPRIEHCRDARVCGGAAAYIPDSAPDDVFVRTTLQRHEAPTNQSAHLPPSQ